MWFFHYYFSCLKLILIEIACFGFGVQRIETSIYIIKPKSHRINYFALKQNTYSNPKCSPLGYRATGNW